MSKSKNLILVEDRACSNCGASPYEAYSYNKWTCRPCYLERGRRYREANWQRHLERMSEWAKEAKETRPKWRWAAYTVPSIRKRAKKYGVPFDIDREYLEQIAPDECPVLKIPLDYKRSVHGYNSPSVDRLVPELGYTRENINVISSRANLIKSDATWEEIEAVASWIKRLTNEATIS